MGAANRKARMSWPELFSNYSLYVHPDFTYEGGLQVTIGSRKL